MLPFTASQPLLPDTRSVGCLSRCFLHAAVRVRSTQESYHADAVVSRDTVQALSMKNTIIMSFPICLHNFFFAVGAGVPLTP